MQNAPEAITGKEKFLADLDRVRDRGPAWANTVRRAAADQFATLPFPNRKMEEWRFTNVAPIVRSSFNSLVNPATTSIAAKDIEPFSYLEKNWTELVFVDGFFSASLSRVAPGIQAGSLHDAIGADNAVVSQFLNKSLNGSANVFNALNTAFLLDGAFVHIGKDVALAHPVHMLFVSTKASEGRASHPRNLIVTERNSRATIVESYVSLANAGTYFNNVVTEIRVGEGASVKYLKLHQEAPEAFHLASIRVHQERDSRFHSLSFSQCAKIARNELSVKLAGEGCDCSLNGLYMADGDQLVDNMTAIEHAKPHCASWIGYKGVLQDRSNAVFSGKIVVQRGAQKTDSKQLNQNLLLSDKATVDTKPLLEIFADDVKCTHGATVGPPPRELVFYFQTRGMSEAMALGMLTYGFADEVVGKVEEEPVRERLERFVFNKYSPVPA